MIGAPIGGSGIGGVTSIDTYGPFLLRPDGDTATDGWTNQAESASNIYQAIDEVTADDSEFVQSPRKVSATSSPTTADLKVRLFDGATMIVEWTHGDIGVDYVDVEQTLTAGQFASISGFTNLFLEFDDNQGNVYRFQLADPPLGTDQPIKVKYRYKKIAG